MAQPTGIGLSPTGSSCQTPRPFFCSYPTVTQAARAYDKVSLKLLDKAVNCDRSEYDEDIIQMGRADGQEYIEMIRELAKSTKPSYELQENITACPEGWYEVKIKMYNVETKMYDWEFLGRFLDLGEAQRCYQEAASHQR